MGALEAMDDADRRDGTPRPAGCLGPGKRDSFSPSWRPPPPDGEYLEIGTSGGYSAPRISLACHERGKATTWSSIRRRSIAAATFKLAGVEGIVKPGGRCAVA
jgi:hypothetical protein